MPLKHNSRFYGSCLYKKKLDGWFAVIESGSDSDAFIGFSSSQCHPNAQAHNLGKHGMCYL